MQDQMRMSTHTEDDAAEASMNRRLSRLERQARVGILRNPNSPPRPPARRATLTGRWPSLRSSRRPAGSLVQDAADSVVTQLSGTAPEQPHKTRQGRNGATIDIAGLMASVEDIGTLPPSRTPFAAAFRDDIPENVNSKKPVERPGKPSILKREAWIGQQDSAEDADALGDAFAEAQQAREDSTPAPRDRRRAALMILLLAVMLGAMALIVFPASAVISLFRGAQ